MKIARAIILIIGVLCAIALGGTVAVDSDAKAKAKKYQIARTSEADALFGDAYTPIGDPQVYVYVDPEIVMDAKAEDGTPYLSEEKIQSTGKRPTQLKTVQFLVSNARLASGIGLVVCAIVLAILRRKG